MRRREKGNSVDVAMVSAEIDPELAWRDLHHSDHLTATVYRVIGTGSFSATGTAGRTTTPTGMPAFSMFSSWLTVTN